MYEGAGASRYMVLLAAVLGLNIRVGTTIRSEAIGLDDRDVAYDTILIGYPKNRFRRIPKWHKLEVGYR
jgi:hypothetical protein